MTEIGVKRTGFRTGRNILGERMRLRGQGEQRGQGGGAQPTTDGLAHDGGEEVDGRDDAAWEVSV